MTVKAVVVNRKPKKVTAIALYRPKPKAVVAVKILRGQQGLNGSVTNNVKQEGFTPTSGQTSFILANTVVNPHLSRLFINGQKVSYGSAYSFSTNMNILFWDLSDYDLDSNDTVELYYFI